MPADIDLLAVERIFQRWASAVNGGIPDARGMSDKSRPPPLPPDLAMYVDKDYMRAPADIHLLVELLYRKHLSPEEAARKLGCSRQQVYVLERQALYYFLGCFRSNGILTRFEQRTQRSKRRKQAQAQQQKRAAARMPAAVIPVAAPSLTTTDSCALSDKRDI